jgi:hypothetical protein
MLNSSPARCVPPPLPAEPKLSLPGDWRSSATTSATDFTGTDGCATSTTGNIAPKLTGRKSFSMS